MNPLAATIYEILRQRVSLDDPLITYKELARECRDADAAFESVTHRSRDLYAALWEVGNRCRRDGLPPLPALVVRADSRRPGDAYYEGMPELRRDERIAAWRRDLDAVRRAAYSTPP